MGLKLWQLLYVMFIGGVIGWHCPNWFHPFWFALIMAFVLGVVNAHFWFRLFRWYNLREKPTTIP